MKTVACNLPDSLYNALVDRIDADQDSCDHVVSMALSQFLGRPLHTLFQVSTSAALVEGLYQGAVRVSRRPYMPVFQPSRTCLWVFLIGGWRQRFERSYGVTPRRAIGRDTDGICISRFVLRSVR